MKSGNRTTALLAAAALSVSVSVPLSASAATATDTPTPAGAGQEVQTERAAASAEKASVEKVAVKKVSVKKLKAKLRKAVKAKRRAATAVETAETKLQALRDAGTAAIFTYQSASVALDEARTKHAAAKAALDRAQGLVDSEDALWADLDKRMVAAQAGYKPLRDAYDAASARQVEMQNAVQSLRAQQQTAWTNQNDAAVAASNVQAEITQVQDAFNAAWAAEQQAWEYKEACRIDFANRKAQWDDTRKRNGHWEGLRNGNWRLVPGLDDAEALLDRAQAEYNQRKAQRLDIEAHLGQLNARLNEIQADIQHWAAVAADLQNQINAYTQPLADQAAAVAAADAAMRAYATQHIDPLHKEAAQLDKDLAAAKANLPALVAAEKPLADAVTQASAALAAATPAHDSAQAAIDAAQLVLSRARTDLGTAEAKVKKLKKRIRKARGRR